MATSKRAKELAAKGKYWRSHVAAWSDSGLSQAEYWRRYGLKAHNLCYLGGEVGRGAAGRAFGPGGDFIG